MNLFYTFVKKPTMIKKIILFVLIILIFSCNKKNNIDETLNKIAVVTNSNGTYLFADQSLKDKKIKLDYAEKIKIKNDIDEKILQVTFNKNDYYINKNDFEIIISKFLNKSFFSKDCYCLSGLNDSLVLTNFPKVRDSIVLYKKDGKIRFIKSKIYLSNNLSSEYFNNINNNEPVDTLNTYYISKSHIDFNNKLSGTLFNEQKELYLECYNSKNVFQLKSKKAVKSKYYKTLLSNYVIELFNTDLLFVKLGRKDFVKDFSEYDYKNEIIRLDQSDKNIKKKIKLYDVNNIEKLELNKEIILFSYLRDFKIIRSDKYERIFVKILLKNDNLLNSKEYYIDLKEVSNFAEIVD